MTTTEKNSMTSEPDSTMESSEEEEIYTTESIETMMPSSYSTLDTTKRPDGVEESEKPAISVGEEMSTAGPGVLDNTTMSSSSASPIPSLEGVDYKHSKLILSQL